METLGNITLYNADCMEIMKGFADKQFDLAIVDPPYGINADNMQMGTNLNRKGKNQYPGESTASKIKKGRLNQGSGKLKNRILNNSDCSWDNNPPSLEYFEQLFRISKNQIIWGGNYFPLPPSRGYICWDKLQPWENFSQFELAWTSYDKPASMFRYSNTGGANTDKKFHPTQKPVQLYKWLLSKYASEEYSIIDTHSGSLSIALACHDFGCKLTAIELNKEYYDQAKQRLQSHQRQLNLFR